MLKSRTQKSNPSLYLPKSVKLQLIEFTDVPHLQPSKVHDCYAAQLWFKASLAYNSRAAEQKLFLCF